MGSPDQGLLASYLHPHDLLVGLQQSAANLQDKLQSHARLLESQHQPVQVHRFPCCQVLRLKLRVQQLRVDTLEASLPATSGSRTTDGARKRSPCAASTDRS